MKVKEVVDIEPLDESNTILLEIYKSVYSELGVDFMELENDVKVFNSYRMSLKRQEEIAESILKKSKLPEWRKNSIMSYYWLGSSPSGFMDDKQEG